MPDAGSEYRKNGFEIGKSSPRAGSVSNHFRAGFSFLIFTRIIDDITARYSDHP